MFRLKKRAVYFLIIVSITGCTSQTISTDPGSKLDPFLLAQIKDAINNSQKCGAPVAGRVNLSPSFRYGCFCGREWPKPTRLEKEKKFDSMSLPEKAEVLKYYFKIRPIDDIDLACRDHDVCYLINGDYNADCNKALMNQMKFIHDVMDGISQSNSQRNNIPLTKTKEWRCKILAHDIYGVYLTIFATNNTDDPVNDYSLDVVRGAFTPVVVAAAAAFRSSIWSSDPYPHEDERCILPSKYSEFLREWPPSKFSASP